LKNKRVLPFQNMTSEGWQNLALVAVLAFYVIIVGFDLFSQNLCGNIAMDYCAYWSGGKIVNQSGYADIYDLNLLTKLQKDIYPQGNDPSIPFQLIPIPYLPIFVIPFQFLSLLSLESSFWVWTLLNMVGFILYLQFFTKEMTGHPLPVRVVLMILLSLPVFLNLFWGQVNIWLGICAGEFMRSILSNKPFRAGFWLGGWLLKPQLLVLIIPVLLIQRSMKMLTGFTISVIAALAVSFSLIGVKGFIGLANLLLGSAQGGSASNPEIMMNWRMLGLHLASYISPLIGWTVAILGSVLTILSTWYIFRKPILPSSQKYVLALFGLFAATSAVTWHAHLSMSIILIPPIIYLYMQNRLPKKLFSLWVLMPVMVMMLVYILAALMQAKILPDSLAQFLNLLAGLRGLVLNLLFLGWTVVEFRKMSLLPDRFPAAPGDRP
jgi:hypothetical protein